MRLMTLQKEGALRGRVGWENCDIKVVGVWRQQIKGSVFKAESLLEERAALIDVACNETQIME